MATRHAHRLRGRGWGLGYVWITLAKQTCPAGMLLLTRLWGMKAQFPTCRSFVPLQDLSNGASNPHPLLPFPLTVVLDSSSLSFHAQCAHPEDAPVPGEGLRAGRTSEMPAKQKPMPIPGRQAQEPRQDSDPRSEFCHSGNKGQSRRHLGTDRFGKNFLDWCKRTGTAQFGASKSEGPKGEGPPACLLPRLMAAPL